MSHYYIPNLFRSQVKTIGALHFAHAKHVFPAYFKIIMPKDPIQTYIFLILVNDDSLKVINFVE